MGPAAANSAPIQRASPALYPAGNSKAALMLSGLIPSDGSDHEELKRRLLAGRYGEVRMLFFLGKDVFRWIEQCIEWAERIPELHDAEIAGPSLPACLRAVRQPL